MIGQALHDILCIWKAGNKNNIEERSRWPVSYHSGSDDLMWAELVYLLTYLQKRSIPYVGSSSECGPEAAAAMQNTPLPPHNTKGLSTYPQITACSPMMTKVTVDPSWGQGDKWQGFLPSELKNGLAGAHSIPAGGRTEGGQALHGRGMRGGSDCWLQPPTNQELLPLPSNHHQHRQAGGHQPLQATLGDEQLRH